MPPPSPPSDETTDDSGFHSGWMPSNSSCYPKSIIKPCKTVKRSESQPERMNLCESIDFKEAFRDGRKTSEVNNIRS